MKYNTIVFFGRPSAGKGTQIDLLINDPQLVIKANEFEIAKYAHVTTGGISRIIKNTKPDSDLAKTMKSYDNESKLYPNELMYEVLLSYMESIINEKKILSR